MSQHRAAHLGALIEQIDRGLQGPFEELIGAAVREAVELCTEGILDDESLMELVTVIARLRRAAWDGDMLRFCLAAADLASCYLRIRLADPALAD